MIGEKRKIAGMKEETKKADMKKYKGIKGS